MSIATDLLAANLLSPVVLAFGLGLVARALRSDLEIPPAIQAYLSLFLLLAIGLDLMLREPPPAWLAPSHLRCRLKGLFMVPVRPKRCSRRLPRAWPCKAT